MKALICYILKKKGLKISFLLSFSQAIYELSRGEQDLIEDLKLARKVSGFFFLAVEDHIRYPRGIFALTHSPAVVLLDIFCLILLCN